MAELKSQLQTTEESLKEALRQKEHAEEAQRIAFQNMRTAEAELKAAEAVADSEVTLDFEMFFLGIE